MKTIKTFFLQVLSLTFILCSCYTAKKAERQVSKALSLQPEVVAKIARDAFPCVTLKSDTAISFSDSTIYLQLPDSIPYTDWFGMNNRLSFDHEENGNLFLSNDKNHLPGNRENYPVLWNTKTITITKVIEDSAKIKLLRSDLVKMERANDELTGKVERKNKWILWLWVAVATMSFYFIFKIVKLFA